MNTAWFQLIAFNMMLTTRFQAVFQLLMHQQAQFYYPFVKFLNELLEDQRS